MLNKNEIAGRANIFSFPDAFDISPTRYVEELIYDNLRVVIKL